MSIFDDPSLSTVKLTNVSVPDGSFSVTKGVTIEKGKNYTFYGAAQIAELKAEYDKGGVFKTYVDANSDLTVETTSSVDTTAGASVIKSPLLTAAITIGVAGKTGVDTNFTAPADQVAQNINLGALIPKHSVVLSSAILGLEDFGTTQTIALTLGTASAGTQLIASGACNDKDSVLASAAGSAPLVNYPAAAANVWIGATPSANWSTVTTGAWAVLVSYYLPGG